ncbi:MAG: response regulator [Erysipelotrichaceae bacterium]
MGKAKANVSAERTYALAAKQCGVTLWIYDFSDKSVHNLENSTNIKAFDHENTIVDNPETFLRETSSLYPDDIPTFIEMFNKILAGEQTAKSSGRWWNEDRNLWWWYQIAYTTIYDENNIPSKAIGTAIDIGERVRLEERYEEEIKWRKVHNKDVIGSFKMNLSQNICEDGQSDNKTILSFLGNGSVDGFFEREYLTHLDPDDLAKYKKRFNRKSLLKMYREGKTSITQESYVRFSSDTILWIQIELDMFQNPKNGEIEAYIYALDINDKKMARAMVDAVVDIDYDYMALLEADVNRYKIYSNTTNSTSMPPLEATDYAQAVSDYAHAYLVEEDIEKNIQDMSVENIRKQLADKKVYTSYWRVKESNGEISRKKLQYSYLDRSRNKVLITRSDITNIYNEEQQMNEALKNALLEAQQANKAKSEFLSRMSHEIRTPMNAIIGMSALAANFINDPNQVAQYLSKIGISARFLLSLINDILDMSRIESGKMMIRNDVIPFEDFINEINSIAYAQAEEKGVEYDAVLTSFTEEDYIGDATKLKQVIINIITNAIKFTDKGGRVQFIVHQEKIKQNEALMKFTINDTGVGINEEFLPRLFDSFAQGNEGNTTPYGGTGLGLAICKNLVDLMEGKISVNSIKGIGTEFVVEIKLGISETSKTKIDKQATLRYNHLKALIVDDDIIICQHTKAILMDMKIKAEYVVSGAKALEIIRKKWQSNMFFDIIFIDWKMPDMNGIETTREIRKIVGKDVTIVIMTAYDWAAIEMDAKNAGVDLLISKPLFKSTINSTLEQLYGDGVHEVVEKIKKEYDFSGKRVLLVEDHILNIEVAKKLLNVKNLEVDVAENGLQAIETFAQKPDGYYDAILMDIRMPIMDGLTATKSIRQMRKSDAKSIPIIAMTANAFEEDIEATKDVGMNAHLAKPIEPALLYQTMQRFLMEDK